MTTMTVLDSTGSTVAVEKPLAPGQGLMAASRPVVIASDQSAVPVSGTVTANVGTGTQPVSGTFWQATQPVSGTFWQATQPVSNAGTFAVQAAQSGTWNIGTATTVTTVSTVTNLAQFGGAAINLGAGAVGTGTLRITQASDSPVVTAMGAVADAAWTGGSGSQIALLKAVAGAALDTTTPSPVKIDQTTDGTTNRVNAVPGSTAFALIPAPSTYRVATSAASTNAANVKSSAGCIKGIQGVNHAAVPVYIHFYDMTTSPTVGTSTIRKTQEVPASAAFAFDYGTGIGLATGISISMTKGSSADTDTTVLASGDITSLNVDYH